MAKNTGLLLSEARGPLNNLLDNLSGEHAEYWLKALKKLLRKEELPEPPKEVLDLLASLDSRKIAKDKIDYWVKILQAIPAVCEVIISGPGEHCLIDMFVYPNLADFLTENKEDNRALFTLGVDGKVDYIRTGKEITDDVFENWSKTVYIDIYTFCKEVIKLGELYQQAVPTE